MDISDLYLSLLPGGIEAMEARGQRELVRGEVLPIQCRNVSRADLESLGIVFGEPVDDLFVAVTLPTGWRKEASDHSMWSYLLDDKGRRRASIFYKAAFYDRDAFYSLTPFYLFNSRYFDTQGNKAQGRPAQRQSFIVNGEGVEVKVLPMRAYDDFRGGDQDDADLKAWIDETYPDWRNPLAYW